MANSSSQNPCGRILLVDDNCLGLAARRRVLEELGHEVLTSGNPAEALELCQKQLFDVVITDYKMPAMNGVQLIGSLKKLHPATAVILISGFADALGLDEESTGADIVLQKSANEVSQLIRAVSRLLRNQRTPKKPPSSHPSSSAVRHKRH